MKKRKGFEILYNPQQQEWRNTSCCPVCGLPKTEWKRRTDWTCCSVKCSDEHNKINLKYWPNVRLDVFRRDDFTCVKCGFSPERKYVDTWGEHEYHADRLGEYFVADHIIPIAVGGDEWDMDNLQTLCTKCNKEKTKTDAAKIAKHRLKEQLIKAGQKLFGEDE